MIHWLRRCKIWIKANLNSTWQGKATRWRNEIKWSPEQKISLKKKRYLLTRNNTRNSWDLLENVSSVTSQDIVPIIVKRKHIVSMRIREETKMLVSWRVRNLMWNHPSIQCRKLILNWIQVQWPFGKSTLVFWRGARYQKPSYYPCSKVWPIFDCKTERSDCWDNQRWRRDKNYRCLICTGDTWKFSFGAEAYKCRN